jgi:hypothetical protein
MAGTFGDMKTRIAADILRDDLSIQIANAIPEAIKLWEGERFVFNEKRYKINTVATQEYYDFIAPTLLTVGGAAVGTSETVLEIDSITATISNMPYRLDQRTQQWFDQYQALPSQYKGPPDRYGIFADQLRLFPVPDNVYPLIVSCLARLNTLSADVDANAWMTEGEGLIREQAKLQIYRDVLRDAEGIANAQQAIYGGMSPDGSPILGHLESLKRKMAGKVYTGRQAAWQL